jgi:hypothetical protein
MMDVSLVRHNIKYMVDIGICKARQQNVGNYGIREVHTATPILGLICDRANAM